MFDVVIMGGGFAGQVQARHLLLNVPGIRIALVDPRSDEEIAAVEKVGESSVEIASTFLLKDLGLHEYLIENQLPKHALNYHWPKQADATGTMDDYFSMWFNRAPPVPSFHFHRGRFETDLLAMNVAKGVVHIVGRVSDIDLTPGSAPNRITVSLPGGSERILEAKHLIDAAGRAFLIGRKTDNVVRRPDNLDNGAAWLRVTGVDREIFDDGYHPNRTMASHYYGTNHFFGHGHWVWMIPIDRHEASLSIGVMFHNSEVNAGTLNTREKLLAFLKENHKVVHRLVESGEVLDFRFRNRVAHWSREMFSPDNWYVLGDSAAFGDALYSLGTSCIALAADSITSIIRADLAGDEDVEEKRKAFNDYNVHFNQFVVRSYRHHGKTLGNASIMSWRIYAEYMLWFGSLLPTFLGKWHLDPGFTKVAPRLGVERILEEVHEMLLELANRGANIGFMDSHRADQLAFGYDPISEREPVGLNALYEPGRINLFRWTRDTLFFKLLFLCKLTWRGFGLRGFLRPRRIALFARTASLCVLMAVLSGWHRLKQVGRPKNSEVRAQEKEFASYRPPTEANASPPIPAKPAPRKVPALGSPGPQESLSA